MKCFTEAGDCREWFKSLLPNPRGILGGWRDRLKKTGPLNLKNKIERYLFHLTSVLTNWFPWGGARVLDTLVLPLLGHPALLKFVDFRNAKALPHPRSIRKILVIPDIHIGDAIMMQGAVQAFRDFFPDARIDYVVKRSAACLIEGNPAINHLYPRFVGTDFPTPGDLESVRRLVAENHYDLCFNGSPFFEDKTLFPERQAILNFMTVAPRLMRNEMDRKGINHFLHQSYFFTEKILRGRGLPGPAEAFRGVPVTLSDEAVEKAQAFLRGERISPDKPVFFLNPDTASPYTLIPFQYQAWILREWLKMDCTVILGASFTHKEMGEKLLKSLSPEERVRLTPPNLPMDAYAALIDFADLFLSGDTGPLHIAAARKVSRSGNFNFRNRTFVISVFGATPSRMSGYDSTDPLYPPANQDAPSRTYVSESPCRNITCVNKMLKTCEKPRCFEALDVEEILADIRLHLKNRKPRASLLAS